MNRRFLQLIGVAAVLVAVVLILRFVRAPVDTQTQARNATSGAAATGKGLATPWGEPDLQGIWTRDSDEPLQRPSKYGTKESLTDEERAALDKQIAAIVGREADESRRKRWSGAGAAGSADAASSCNNVLRSIFIVLPSSPERVRIRRRARSRPVC